MEKANAAIGGNLYGHPLSQYLEMYQSAAPRDLSAQSGIPYFPSIYAFRLHFLGTLHEVSHPDFTVRYLESGAGISAGGLQHGPDSAPALPSGGDVYPAHRRVCGVSGSAVGRRLSVSVPGQVYPSPGKTVWRPGGSFPPSNGRAPCRPHDVRGLRIPTGDRGSGGPLPHPLEGDDEYPPSAQILFSDNFPSAFSAEDATYIGDIVLNYLAEFEQSLSIETELIIDL